MKDRAGETGVLIGCGVGSVGPRVPSAHTGAPVADEGASPAKAECQWQTPKRLLQTPKRRHHMPNARSSASGLFPGNAAGREASGFDHASSAGEPRVKDRLRRSTPPGEPTNPVRPCARVALYPVQIAFDSVREAGLGVSWRSRDGRRYRPVAAPLTFLFPEARP